MKKLFKTAALIMAAAVFLSACGGADTNSDVSSGTSGETVSDGKSLLDLRVMVDHPGAPGFDSSYDFLAYYGEEFAEVRLLPGEYVLSSDYPEIKIEKNTITIPADFAEKHKDLVSINIYAKHKENPQHTDYYPLTIKHWEMSFNDEFDTYDKNVWTFDGYNPGGIIGKDMVTGADAWCGKDPDLPYVRDGNLILSIKKGKKTLYNQGTPWVSDYQSSNLTTFTSFNQQYGCFMARIKVPPYGDSTAGSISAFWLMPTEGVWGQSFMFKKTGSHVLSGWNCGEIDIIEYSPAWSGKPQLQITEHWWDDSFEKLPSGSSTEIRFEYEKLGIEYINMACVWTPNGLFTYVDGILAKSRVGLQPTDQTAYMLLSQGIGSLPTAAEKSWAGSFTDDNLEKKTEYAVDFVRAYK